jgi:hypothetical protein
MSLFDFTKVDRAHEDMIEQLQYADSTKHDLRDMACALCSALDELRERRKGARLTDVDQVRKEQGLCYNTKRRPKGYFTQLVNLSEEAANLLSRGLYCGDVEPLTPYGEECKDCSEKINHLLEQIRK